VAIIPTWLERAACPADAHGRGRRLRGGAAVAAREGGPEEDLVKLKLDLHEVYNRGRDIDRALLDIIEEAVRTKATEVEIIPGKGSGQLKKRVLRFLDQKEIKALYDRVEKDSRNFGRVFVHFRWK
jgi:DNA-nicking Smr family endonuclease